MVCGRVLWRGGGGIVNTRLGDVNVNMFHNRQHIACTVQFNITRPHLYTQRYSRVEERGTADWRRRTKKEEKEMRRNESAVDEKRTSGSRTCHQQS